MDESTRLRMRRAHTNHTHTCVCGKTVRGNGGWASHRWACPQYQARIEERVIERGGSVLEGDVNVRRAPRWRWNGTSWEQVTAIVRDEDCPECGYPETYAEGTTFENGPDRIGCRKCGWTQEIGPA